MARAMKLNGPTVVMLHGLWMASPVMGLLARSLRNAGMTTYAWSYASRSHDLDYNAALLTRRLAALPDQRIALVAHSYGGVVALRALNLRPDPRVTRIVLMGAPVAGSAAGRVLAQRPAWRIALGRTAEVWERGPGVRVPPEARVGMIAGTRRIGLGRFVTRLEGENDGVVRLAETRLPGLADHLTMATSHSWMLVQPRVAHQVRTFIEHGRFER